VDTVKDSTVYKSMQHNKTGPDTVTQVWVVMGVSGCVMVCRHTSHPLYQSLEAT
jgi:hypothetical protein